MSEEEIEAVTDAVIMASTTSAERAVLAAGHTPDRIMAGIRLEDLRRLPPHLREQARGIARAAIAALDKHREGKAEDDQRERDYKTYRSLGGTKNRAEYDARFPASPRDQEKER